MYHFLELKVPFPLIAMAVRGKVDQTVVPHLPWSPQVCPWSLPLS